MAKPKYGLARCICNGKRTLLNLLRGIVGALCRTQATSRVSAQDSARSGVLAAGDLKVGLKPSSIFKQVELAVSWSPCLKF